MQRIFFLSLLLLSLVASGCGKSQIVKDSWKFTTKQYRTYLNTPAFLDLEDKGGCELYELALGEAVLNMDAELFHLVRAMENSDHDPDELWVTKMMERFPWISGVALVDGSGDLIARYPTYFAKDFSIEPLLQPDPKRKHMGALRAYVQKTEAGPEIYLANPVFSNDDMRGLIVAHFDPRSLSMLSPNPGAFIMASPMGVLWPGDFGQSGSSVSAQDWESLLRKKSCGVIGDKGAQFFWTTRYVGNLPLVYAMPTTSGQHFASPVDSDMTGEKTSASQEEVAPSVTPLEKTPVAGQNSAVP